MKTAAEIQKRINEIEGLFDTAEAGDSMEELYCEIDSLYMELERRGL